MIQAGWPSGLRRWFKEPFTSMGWVEYCSSHFVDIPIQSIVSFILNTCRWYLLPLS
eukprot:UN15887